MTTTPPDPDQPFGAGVPAYPGEQPPAAGVPPQVGPTPEQPSSIATAVKLMLVGAGLTVVGLVFSLLSLDGLKDDVRDEVLKSDANASQSLIDTTYSITIASLIIGPLIAVGLWLWMAWKNGQGRGWARVVATILGGINVLFTLLGLAAASATGISIGINLLSLALAVVILIMLWRPESTRFYQAVAHSRQLR